MIETIFSSYGILHAKKIVDISIGKLLQTIDHIQFISILVLSVKIWSMLYMPYCINDRTKVEHSYGSFP